MGNRVNPEHFRLGITTTWDYYIRDPLLANIFIYRLVKNILYKYSTPYIRPGIGRKFAVISEDGELRQLLPAKDIRNPFRTTIKNRFTHRDLIFSHLYLGLTDKVDLSIYYFDSGMEHYLIKNNVSQRTVHYEFFSWKYIRERAEQNGFWNYFLKTYFTPTWYQDSKNRLENKLRYPTVSQKGFYKRINERLFSSYFFGYLNNYMFLKNKRVYIGQNRKWKYVPKKYVHTRHGKRKLIQSHWLKNTHRYPLEWKYKKVKLTFQKNRRKGDGKITWYKTKKKYFTKEDIKINLSNGKIKKYPQRPGQRLLQNVRVFKDRDLEFFGWGMWGIKKHTKAIKRKQGKMHIGFNKIMVLMRHMSRKRKNNTDMSFGLLNTIVNTYTESDLFFYSYYRKIKTYLQKFSLSPNLIPNIEQDDVFNKYINEKLPQRIKTSSIFSKDLNKGYIILNRVLNRKIKEPKDIFLFLKKYKDIFIQARKGGIITNIEYLVKEVKEAYKSKNLINKVKFVKAFKTALIDYVFLKWYVFIRFIKRFIFRMKKRAIKDKIFLLNSLHDKEILNIIKRNVKNRLINRSFRKIVLNLLKSRNAYDYVRKYKESDQKIYIRKPFFPRKRIYFLYRNEDDNNFIVLHKNVPTIPRTARIKGIKNSLKFLLSTPVKYTKQSNKQKKRNKNKRPEKPKYIIKHWNNKIFGSQVRNIILRYEWAKHKKIANEKIRAKNKGEAVYQRYMKKINKKKSKAWIFRLVRRYFGLKGKKRLKFKGGELLALRMAPRLINKVWRQEHKHKIKLQTAKLRYTYGIRLRKKKSYSRSLLIKKFPIEDDKFSYKRFMRKKIYPYREKMLRYFYRIGHPLWLINLENHFPFHLNNNSLNDDTLHALKILKFLLRYLKLANKKTAKQRIFFFNILLLCCLSLLRLLTKKRLFRRLFLFTILTYIYLYSFKYQFFIFNHILINKRFRLLYNISKLIGFSLQKVAFLNETNSSNIRFYAMNNRHVNAQFIANYMYIKLARYFTIHEILGPIMSRLKRLNYISGFRFVISGRLTRKQRAWFIVKHYNKMPQTTVAEPIEYASGFRMLRFGMVGFKVFLLYQPDYIVRTYFYMFEFINRLKASSPSPRYNDQDVNRWVDPTIEEEEKEEVAKEQNEEIKEMNEVIDVSDENISNNN